MYKVVRENKTMAVRDEHQLAAFLNNGWSLLDTAEKTEETVADTVPFCGDVKYTKTDINRMSTAELQAFALEKGIDGADSMTGGDLKKVLIEKLGL